LDFRIPLFLEQIVLLKEFLPLLLLRFDDPFLFLISLVVFSGRLDDVPLASVYLHLTVLLEVLYLGVEMFVLEGLQLLMDACRNLFVLEVQGMRTFVFVGQLVSIGKGLLPLTVYYLVLGYVPVCGTFWKLRKVLLLELLLLIVDRFHSWQ